MLVSFSNYLNVSRTLKFLSFKYLKKSCKHLHPPPWKLFFFFHAAHNLPLVYLRMTDSLWSKIGRLGARIRRKTIMRARARVGCKILFYVQTSTNFPTLDPYKYWRNLKSYTNQCVCMCGWHWVCNDSRRRKKKIEVCIFFEIQSHMKDCCWNSRSWKKCLLKVPLHAIHCVITGHTAAAIILLLP